MFLMMSWRNLWRHRRRSVVVISSIAIGIFAMIFTMGIMNGFNVQMVENTIRTSLGHVAIHEKGFQDNMKLEFRFTPGDDVYRAIAENSGIVSHAPRLKVQGMIKSSETSRGVLIVGIDPVKEKTVSNLFEYTSRENGSAFLASSNANEIMISRGMADILNVIVGDKVVLMIQDSRNEIIGVGLHVSGIFQTPVDSFDKYMVFTGLEKLQEITAVGNSISELTIITKDKNTVEPVARFLQRRIGVSGLEILTWKDMAPNLVSAIKLFDSMMFIFFMIIFVTVIFSVANTLIMAIMERFHEIGVMKCIGTAPNRIFIMIIFEAMNLGAVGLLAGLAGGLALVGALSVAGIDFSFYMESMRTWGSGSVIYPTIRLYDIAMAAVIVLFTTLTAALYPAVKAARIKPLQALHYV
jgi:ABC-type lipoprotein release transport system permease subunit